MVYIKCEICNYISCDKSNYNKHIKTKKHKMALKAREETIAKAKNKNVTKHVNMVQEQLNLLCKYCGKEFARKSNLKRHLATSCKAKDIQQDINDFHHNEIISHMKILEQKNNILQDQILSLKDKYNTQIEEENKFLKSHIIKSNSNNQPKISNINYIQNNFINALTMEQLASNLNITYNDLLQTETYGYANGISNIIYNHYIKEVPIEKRAFHCLDIPRKIFIYHLEKIGWTRDNRQLEHIIKLVHNLLLKRINDYKIEEFKKIDNYNLEDKSVQLYNEKIAKFDSLMPSKCITHEQKISEFERESNKIIKNISYQSCFTMNKDKSILLNNKTKKFISHKNKIEDIEANKFLENKQDDNQIATPNISVTETDDDDNIDEITIDDEELSNYIEINDNTLYKYLEEYLDNNEIDYDVNTMVYIQNLLICKYIENDYDNITVEDVIKKMEPKYNSKQEYENILDCSQEYIYDVMDEFVFTEDKKSFVGIRNNKESYVVYKDEIYKSFKGALIYIDNVLFL